MSGDNTPTASTHEVVLDEYTSSREFKYPKMTLSTKDIPFVPVTKDSKHIIILGAGVSGLMTAWMLLDKGHRVTIIAEDWAWTKDFDKSRITSQIAGALWEFPPGGCGLTEIESPGLGWANIEHYRDWAMQSFIFYSQYDCIDNDFEKQGHSFGLQMTNLHQFFYSDLQSAPDNEEAMKLKALKDEATKYPNLNLDVKTHNAADLKTKFINVKCELSGQTLQSGYTHRTPIVNTDKAMGYLMALVIVKGASLETRKFDRKIKDFGGELLKDHKADAIVNATGLGAKYLADDDDVYPVRGAIKRIDNTRTGQFRHLNDAYLVPAQVDSNGHPTKTIFIVPRNDDVLYVGSIIQPNLYEKALTPDSPEVRIMWNRAGEFMPTLLQANTVPMFPFAQGLRPFTKRNVKVRADEEADFPLVHNYGHGGSGWTLGIGTARTAIEILDRFLNFPEESVRKTAKDVNREIYGAPPCPCCGSSSEGGH
ncbi:D-amino-acid oxidase [Microdochium nivale]|nr:D-amino-acid oxidase [Microdochium nivale]